MLGPTLHEQLREVAKPLGLDMDYLSRMQPWYVATLVSSTAADARPATARSDGVDYQLAERAHRDGKPIVGPGNRHAAAGLLRRACPWTSSAGSSPTSLDEADSAASCASITEAWRRRQPGRAREGAEAAAWKNPRRCSSSIVVERNRNWLPRIEQMLADPDKDYLVVTGALHMIGPQGLVELLRARGYQITRK